MTYISPRVAIWGAFCPLLYTVYNNSSSRKELRAARVCVYTPVPSVRIPVVLSSLRSPLVLLLVLAVIVVVVVILSHLPHLAVFVSLYRSRCPPRVLPPLFSASLSSSSLSPPPPPSTRVPSRVRGAPSNVTGFLRRYRESFRVRLITVIRLLLVPVYRTLIIIIDFACTSLPCFHATVVRLYVARPRGCATQPTGPAASTASGKPVIHQPTPVTHGGLP